MLEERYRQNAAAIHADDRLIDRTLDAAQPRPKAAPISAGGRRLIIGFVCALALIVTLSAPMLKPPRDVVTSPGELPGTTDTPISAAPLSDELTLSVSDVKLESDSKLSLILTVQGDRVDPYTYINVDYPHLQYLSGSGVGHLGGYEDQQPHEVRYRFYIESKDRDILYALGDYLELTVDRYTSGTTQTETVHEIDWDSMEFSPSETGEPITRFGNHQVVSGIGFAEEPIIDLGNGLSISGLGFTEEGWLIVQSRCPYEAPEPTYTIVWLSPDGTNDSDTNLYMDASHQNGDGEYAYNNQVFHITQEELDSVHLVTHTILAGNIIEGKWSILVDLSHLTEE